MNTPARRPTSRFDDYQKAEIVRYGELTEALNNYIALHVDDFDDPEEKADEIYGKVIDLVIKLTDK